MQHRCAVNRLLTLAASALVLLSPFKLWGQALPALEKAPEIVTGDLPDGISYYIVRNTVLPGFADFALVQPLRDSDVPPREELVNLPHFQGVKPYEFLARCGVGYGPRGFVRQQGKATIFRFADVPVTSSSVADSTLLLLFDLALGSPHRQSVIISGDIDVAVIKERLRILSMTVPQRTAADTDLQYGWRTQEEAAVTTGTGPVGLLRATYRSPRTDAALMNTIQPIMSRLLAREMDIILSRRLRAAFAQAGIPLADYHFRHTGSDATPGDELLSITIETTPECLEAATKILSGVLSTMDEDGVTTAETAFARSVITEATIRDDDNFRMTNAQYVDKCVSACLYGANLASYASLSKLFTARKLDIERERELLGRYISAILSSSRNLRLYAAAPVKPDGTGLLQTFAEDWKEGNSAVSDIPSQADTSALALPRGKVKLSNVATDSFTGGKMWTFSNGASVIFKKTAEKGSFHFGYMVKGGWNEIPQISGDESAFVNDALALESVAGMSGERFRDLLEMNGISLTGAATLSDVRWTGNAPSDKLSLVLKALLAVGVNTAADTGAFDRYCAEEAVRQQRDKYAPEGTRAAMDSLMCPDYPFATGCTPQLPGADFPQRVDTYLKSKGATVRNSLIVLTGDLDESYVIKTLSRTLAGYGNTRQRIVRPRLAYPLRECWSTVSVPGVWRDRGVWVGMSASWPFSSGGNTTLNMACTVLEEELAKDLASKGYSFTVTGEAALLPAEKIAVYVNCRPVQSAGLPADVTAISPGEVLNTVRKVINRLANTNVSPQVLAAAKSALLGKMQAQEADPDNYMSTILYRNAMGRDLTGAYKDRIKAVKASDVKAMFQAMDECKSEFVVR